MWLHTNIKWADSKERLRNPSQIPFQPSTIDNVVCILAHIFGSQDGGVYLEMFLEKLDCSQRIIIWSDVVPWCWHSLDVSRDAEEIRLLVIAVLLFRAPVDLIVHAVDVDLVVLSQPKHHLWCKAKHRRPYCYRS